MKAWVLRRTGQPNKVLSFEDVPTPEPASGELVVDVEAAGVIYPDLLLVRGEYQIALPLPSTPGAELVGWVRAAGPNTTYQPGSRVLGFAYGAHGAFGEQAIVREHDVELLPDDVPAELAVVLPTNYVTAHLALHRRAGLRAGESVVVLGGAGGVGAAAIELAKLAGAHVIGVDASEERARLCEEFGADVGLASTGGIATEVKRLTEGRGADVVIDTVGGDLFDEVRRYVAYEGRLVVVGFTAGRIPELRANHLILRTFAVTGVNAMIALHEHPEIHHAAHQAVVQGLVEGGLRPRIAGVYPLLELPRLLEALHQRRIPGKAVLAVASTVAVTNTLGDA
jgi:NADPH2:quinone reductase